MILPIYFTSQRGVMPPRIALAILAKQSAGVAFLYLTGETGNNYRGKPNSSA